MTKKRIATMATCIALVGAVAVGGTLALLTAKSNEVKNTFTVGKGYPVENALVLDENVPTQDAAGNYTSTSSRTTTGFDYKDLVSGTTLAKDPTFTLSLESPTSWIVAKIDTVDSAFAGSNFTTNGWYKVSGDGTESPYTAVAVTEGTAIEAGLYIYGTPVEAGNKTHALFNTLSYNGNTKPDDMNIKGCAVQAVGADQSVGAVVDTVVKAAVEAMNK